MNALWQIPMFYGSMLHISPTNSHLLAAKQKLKKIPERKSREWTGRQKKEREREREDRKKQKNKRGRRQ